VNKIKLVILIFIFPFICNANTRDSLHLNIFGGGCITSFITNKVILSSNPLGYKMGIGFSKDLFNDNIVGFDLWYQKININNLQTNTYDKEYNVYVHLNTNIEWNNIAFNLKYSKKINKFEICMFSGVYYLLKSNSSQITTNNSTDSITYLNVNNKYMIYDYQKESYFNYINPILGFSFTYNPLKTIGIRYETYVDIIKSPTYKFHYFNSFNSFMNNIVLTIKIK
jgi:hypothetical protein